VVLVVAADLDEVAPAHHQRHSLADRYLLPMIELRHHADDVVAQRAEGLRDPLRIVETAVVVKQRDVLASGRANAGVVSLGNASELGIELTQVLERPAIHTETGEDDDDLDGMPGAV